ncbi:MAG: CopD family protein [Planctomycetota bacterium]|jgi:uncharacterized membrane protein
MYLWLKWIHLLGLVVYVGGFLALTRWLGHAVRFETAQAREDAYRVLRRMHKFVDWGGLALMLIAGLWLLLADPMGKLYLKQGYFHMKLFFVLVLLVCDAALSVKLFRMKGEGPQPGAVYFKVLHGLAGLATMGTLLAVVVVRG